MIYGLYSFIAIFEAVDVCIESIKLKNLKYKEMFFNWLLTVKMLPFVLQGLFKNAEISVKCTEMCES